MGEFFVDEEASAEAAPDIFGDMGCTVGFLEVAKSKFFTIGRVFAVTRKLPAEGM